MWRQRERRARLDSKDSLEDEGQCSNGHHSRDKMESNHSRSPVLTASAKSKVKQMAKNIDSRSDSVRTGDYGRSSSPTIINRSQQSDR